MDNTTIEGIAIATLSDLFFTTANITPHFSVNDKTPSWDGELFVYKSALKEKSNLYGMCKVQIKGKQMSIDELQKKKCQFKVFLSDLQNYRSNGGIIFFVVGMTEQHKRKIYYNDLLPYDLAEIIEKKKNQTTTTILLKEFPLEPNKITRIVQGFIRNSCSQSSTTPISPIGLSGYLENHTEDDVLSLTVDFPDMFDEPAWLYSSPKARLHIKEPIGKIFIFEMGLKDSPIEVYIRDKCFFNVATVSKRKNEFSVYLGKCIEIILEQKQTAICKFYYNGTIDDVLHGLHFFQDLIRYGEIEFINKSNEKEPIWSGTIDSDINIDEIESDIEVYTKVKDVLLRLNVRTVINVNDLSNADLQFLYNMYKYIVKKEPYVISSDDMTTGIKVYKVGKLKLAFVLINQNDIGRWVDYFDCKEFTLIGKDERGNDFKSSFFLRLQKWQFIEWDNINYYAIEKSIKEITINDFNCVNLNMLILEMLSAYDESSNSELLQSVINLAKYLQECRHETVYILNYLQAICRQRPLNVDERERLIMLRQQESDNATLAGISAILGNKEEYELYLSKLSPELRQQFISFPINNLVSNKGV